MRLTRSKIIGLVATLLVFLIIGGIVVWRQAQPVPVQTTEVNGYLGGEKIGLFDDEQFQKLAEEAGVKVEYRKAGSLAMMDADPEGIDYLFPSSRAAVEYGRSKGVDVSRGDIVFNSPIVLYTHRQVADALVSSGIMSHENNVYTMDMAKAVDAMVHDKTWKDVGWSSGYGQFRIDSTDPVKSNSGNEYAALVATMLNGGHPATAESVNRDAAAISGIFAKSGWMETSSEDSFNQFLNLGVGSKPIMVGYESQILDLSVNNPDAWQQVKDDVVIVYPTPTVWSTHVLIPLNDSGSKVLSLLKSSAVQKLAWERHGFRSANFTGTSSISRFSVPGTVEQVTAVSELPNNDAMQTLITTLSKGQ